MTQTEFQKRWDARRVTEARLIAAEEARRKGRELGARADMVLAKIAGRILTKNISVPVTGAMRIEIKSLDADRGVFEAYGSSWHQSPDLQGDCVEKGAFARSIRDKPEVPLLWAHQHFETIGSARNLREDGYGLKFRGEICNDPDNPRGRQALALMKHGSLNSFSIGFSIEDYTHRSDGVRVLKELKLHEISIVPCPADVTARLIV